MRASSLDKGTFGHTLSVWHGSSVGSQAVCNYLLPADARSIPTSGTFFHEISMTILPLRLIQEEQLSVNGEGMYTKFW